MVSKGYLFLRGESSTSSSSSSSAPERSLSRALTRGSRTCLFWILGRMMLQLRFKFSNSSTNSSMWISSNSADGYSQFEGRSLFWWRSITMDSNPPFCCEVQGSIQSHEDIFIGSVSKVSGQRSTMVPIRNDLFSSPDSLLGL